MKKTGMRFEERLRRLEALEAARQDAEDGRAVLCVTAGDWDVLNSPVTSTIERQAIGARYGVDVDRYSGKVIIGVCLCWGEGSCPVCEEAR